MDFTTFLGTTGATIILIAFVLGQKHIWTDEYFIYDFCNFLGSILLIIYAILLDSVPFFVLNMVWALVSLRDVVVDFKRNKKRTKGDFYEKWMK